MKLVKLIYCSGKLQTTYFIFDEILAQILCVIC